MYRIKAYKAYAAILVAFFAQMSLVTFFDFGSLRPNVMIIITVFFALFTDEKFGWRAGAVSGLLLDIFSIRLFGLNTLFFALCGYIVGKYSNKFYRDSPVTHFIITFAASFFILSPYFFFINLRNPTGMPHLGFFNASVFAASLLNSFLGILICAFLLRIFKLDECNL